MALNRYLYPQKGTNVVQQITLHTRVSVDATGAVTGIVSGHGLTVTASGAGVNAIYTVSIDNASTVNSVVDVNTCFVSSFDKTKHNNIAVKSVSSTGCVLQAYDLQSLSVAPIDVAGDLCVSLVCTLSSVPA
jgi:hypothetical protein